MKDQGSFVHACFLIIMWEEKKGHGTWYERSKIYLERLIASCKANTNHMTNTESNFPSHLIHLIYY